MKEEQILRGAEYLYNGQIRVHVLSKHDGLAYVKVLGKHGDTVNYTYVNYGDLNVIR